MGGDNPPVTTAVPTEPASADDLPLPCPTCGYDLRQLASGRCPECGREARLEEVPTVAELPWHDRRRLGKGRALSRQCWLVLRHPARLADLAGRSIDYAAARRFQILCCVIAWLALAGPAVYGFDLFHRASLRYPGALMLWSTPPPPTPGLVDYLLDGFILLAMLVGLFLWLLTATGVPSYFLHPRQAPVRRQDNAIALSYYAAVPLVLLPAVVGLFAIARGVATIEIAALDGAATRGDVGILMAFWGGILLTASLLGLWMILAHWLIPCLLLTRGLGRSWRRAGAMSIVMLIAWPGLFILWVIGLPLLIFWIECVVLTLAR